MGYYFHLPDVGEGVREAEIVRWLVGEGDIVEQDQPVVEVQTDKAVVELPSPVKGSVCERKWDTGSVVSVGELLFIVKTDDAPLIQRKSRSLATPSVRRLAKEKGICLSNVVGSGKDGRVLEEDLEKHHISVEVREEANETKKEEVTPASLKGKEISLSKIRQVIGERLLHSVTHKPHAIHFDELNVEGLVAWKNHVRKNENSRITYTSILLKMVAYTLTKFPHFNAHYIEETQQVREYSTISIGIATDTPIGLLVPVIYEVEKKNMGQLAFEVNELTELARNGKCSPDRMKGSTFTISNAGAIGGKWAAPIINPPEVAILAIHPIEKRPVIKGESVVSGWRMNVSLAFDHRVLDGADAIRFTQTLEKYTSEPRELLQELI